MASAIAFSSSLSLSSLEALMEEFFSPATSNARKREIEVVLQSFAAQKDSWRQCLQFMAETGNQFVCMFTLNTLETVIRRQWVGMPSQKHAEIRDTVTRFLLDHSASAPSFIRNKLIKLLVDIARTDWPHFYPDFFSRLLDLVTGFNRSDTRRLGLAMLLITSEELATPREDVSTSRKEELRKLLNAQVPNILAALCAVLESVLQKQSKSPSPSTPPPSPASSSQTTPDENAWSSSTATTSSNVLGGVAVSFSTSPLVQHHHQSRLLQIASHKLQQQTEESDKTVRVSRLDPEDEETSTLALRCLGHMFTWISLSSNLTSRLLNVIFQFAALGIQRNSQDQQSSQQGVSATNSNLGILAMTAINELVYKNCIPRDFESYFLHMFRSAFQLLQAVVQEATITSDGETRSGLEYLDDGYVDKLTEFLSSFVASHLGRFEGNSHFPVMEFLALLYKFTFLQTRAESFFSYLDIWSTLVEYVAGSAPPGSLSMQQQGLLGRYREPLLSLGAEVLNRTQFRNAAGQRRQLLDQLDDDVLDDDEETEWQKYLRNCIEVIMKVADLMPDEVLRIISPPWKECCQMYFSLEQHVVSGKVLQLSSAEELESLHCVLRDFASLLQLIGRVSTLFIGDDFLARLQEAGELVKQLIVLAAYGTRMKFYSLQIPAASTSSSPDVLRDFVEVQAHILAALKAWCHWLAKLHTVSLKHSSYEPQCRELTSRITISATAILREENTPAPLVHSAAHFLSTLTGTVRPPSIWKLKEFTELYTCVEQLRFPSEEDRKLVVRALANVLLLHWPGLSEQRWEERQKHLSKFLRDITAQFRLVRAAEGFQTSREMQVQARDVIKGTLGLVGDLVETVLDEMTQTKKLCHDCIREYMEDALWLFPLYVNDREVCRDLFAFFRVVFDGLKAQMGAAAVEAAINTFLALFDRNAIAKAIVAEESSGVRVVEEFLAILEFVVKEPNSSFRKFVPSTLQLCLHHIYPLVADKPTADVKGAVYSLLFHVLLHNQRYFFKPSVVRRLESQEKSSQQEEVLNRSELLAAMDAFGQSFMQPDVSIFQQNLGALEQLNKKWKLYHKSIFTENLTVKFLTVLLQVLVQRSHDLLREEIIVCIFNMAAVDFRSFFDHFIPNFLIQVVDVDNNQRAILKASFTPDTDLPTFTSNAHRFVNDLRYYKICNASVKF